MITRVLPVGILLAHLGWILVFSGGFFPVKTYLPGYGSFTQVPPPLHPGSPFALDPNLVGGVEIMGYEAPYRRLVFIVVDALRSDFVTGKTSGFEFVRGMLREGYGEVYTGVATAPTVTLPRLKALVSGTVPAFLDAILNVVEGEGGGGAEIDSWPYILRTEKGWRIEMYGDDTWERLLPREVFTRTEGTTSFFVSDTVEVDQNVTRHIIPALDRVGHWDGLILHYLGLDHIGHLNGRFSPLMLPKQREMDEAIETIYRGLEDEEGTLLVVCGDHGMTDGGNHGGSTGPETDAAMIVLHPGRRHPQGDAEALHEGMPEGGDWQVERRAQVDIVSTLSLLLGAPIPRNNVGSPLGASLAYLPIATQLRMWQVSAAQLGSLWGVEKEEVGVGEVGMACEAAGGDARGMGVCYWKKAVGLHRTYLERGELRDGERAIRYYEKFGRLSSEVMEGVGAEYDLRLMGLALGGMFLGVAILTGMYGKEEEKGDPVLWGMLILHAASLYASSFVEEEHQLWYFWLQTLWAVQAVRSVRCGKEQWRIFGQMLVLRVIREWNRTGQKWALLPDVRGFLLDPGHGGVMWGLFLLVLLASWVRVAGGVSRCRRTGSGGDLTIWFGRGWLISTMLAGWFILGVKWRQGGEGGGPRWVGWVVDLLIPPAAGDATMLAQHAYVLIGMSGVMGYLAHRVSGERYGSMVFLGAVEPLLLLLSRQHNAPLFGMMWMQAYLLPSARSMKGRSGFSAALFLCLAHGSFFAFGGSNGIASIDLSNGYTGLREFSAPLVLLLTFASNWAGPIWWGIAWTERAEGKVRGLVGLVACGLQVVLGSAILLHREHLFIWTVFSPAWVYAIAWAGYAGLVGVLWAAWGP